MTDSRGAHSREGPGSREKLWQDLSGKIVAGDLSPGSILPSERSLAVEYRISRPAVREALRRLESQDLIVVRPGIGAFVAEVRLHDISGQLDLQIRRTKATARDVVRARLMLDRETARSSSVMATADDLALLKEAVERYESSVTPVERAQADINLHSLVAASTKNPVVDIMFGAIAPHLYVLMLRSAWDPLVAAESGPLHRALVDAIAARDPDLAESVAGRHGEVAERLYGPDLDATLGSLMSKIDQFEHGGDQAGLTRLHVAPRDTAGGKR
jgi:DNA-binding FadR family transcriptional regulator